MAKANEMEELYTPPPSCKGVRVFTIDDDDWSDDPAEMKDYKRVQLCMSEEALQKWVNDNCRTTETVAYELVVVRRIKIIPQPRQFTIVEG